MDDCHGETSGTIAMVGCWFYARIVDDRVIASGL
jgi:hypothetical protein